MRYIYLFKAFQLVAVVTVTGLFLGVHKFCGDVDPALVLNTTNSSQGSQSEIGAAMNESPAGITDAFAVEKKAMSSSNSSAKAPRQKREVPMPTETEEETIVTLGKLFLRFLLNQMPLHVLEPDNLKQFHIVKKRDVYQYDGEPEDLNEPAKLAISALSMIANQVEAIMPSVTPGPADAANNATSSPEEDGDEPPASLNETSCNRWVNGCVAFSYAEFFSFNRNSSITAATFYPSLAFCLVIAFVPMVFLDLYLIYASHLPPGPNSDLCRFCVSFWLWFFALLCLGVDHYNWEQNWSLTNAPVIPHFPSQWLAIEVVGVLVIFTLYAELIFHDWVYTNMPLVSGAKKSKVKLHAI